MRAVKTPELVPAEIAKRLREKVADLNEEVLLAVLAEIEVSFDVKEDPTTEGLPRLVVRCRQEV